MSSWNDLKPECNENIYDVESIKKYYKRISDKYNHIPRGVFEQWIIPLHEDKHTLKNYSWIEFDKINIFCETFSVENLLNLNVIEDFNDLVI